MAKKEKVENSEDGLDAAQVLSSILNDKENKDWHLNFVEEVYYRVPTGSIVWDIYTDGGLPPGLHRFIGPPESGKSSAALEICRNFLNRHPNGRGFYVKAEGRLPEEMKKRSGLKFVYKPEDWKDGTIFVLESNYYEFIINSLRRFIKNPLIQNLFCVIIDSMDGLMLQGDAKKDFSEGNKVAGTPSLTKKFLQSMANEMSKRGHMCLMLSQFSTNISLTPYVGVQDKRNQQGSGGWGPAHFANFAFEFGDAYNQDQIRENDKLPPSPTNKILGKRIKVKFKKSPNEKTGSEISYPIEYGVIGKSSIWAVLEVVDLLKMYGFVNIKGAWIDVKESLISELKEKNLEIEPKFNGERKMIQWFEVHPKTVEYLTGMLKETLVKAVSSTASEEKLDETEKTEF